MALTLTTIAALRNFDLVYITTRGGPGGSTSVPAYVVYDRAFKSGEVGGASAVGVCLVALIFVLAFAINKFAERRRAMTVRREQCFTYRCWACSR